jgi:histidyl-tRNA synthetase
MADVGGDPLPAVGFALGDVVITLLLEKYSCIPQGIGRSSADVLVTVFDDERMLTSTLLASELRQAGLKVATFPEPAKLPKQFRYADRMGIKVAVVLGPDEVVNNQVTIKDLQTGIQQTVPQSGASQAIKQLLERDLPS